jgi:hypothetical protein
VRPGDTAAEHPAFKAQLAGVADPRALELHRSARRLYGARLVAVAVDRAAGVAGALVALAAEELRHLILKRLLQDHPRAQARDRLHRIVALGDSGQHLIELTTQPLARDYLRHAGVPPSFGLVRSEAEATPALHFPGQRDGTVGRVHNQLTDVASAVRIRLRACQGVSWPMARLPARETGSGSSHPPMTAVTRIPTARASAARAHSKY